MKINRLRVTVEPWWYVRQEKDKVALKIVIERSDGEDIYLEKVYPDNDLYSIWQYIWDSAGDALLKYMVENDENRKGA